MTTPHNPIQNNLLGALPMADLKRLIPHLELVPMTIGESYSESGGKLQNVYFPTTAIVSLINVMENGSVSEIASVGNEGMLGISLFVEGNPTPCMSYVRSPGYGYKMAAKLLMNEFNRAGVLERLLLRYTHALITQTSHTAICNLQHSIEQRVCRWLLVSLDRMPSTKLVISQELVPSMFGAGREVVMDALRKLQQDGLIENRLGHITVKNRQELEERVCECYSEIKNEYDRLHGLDFDWRPMPESINAWSKVNSSICAMM